MSVVAVIVFASVLLSTLPLQAATYHVSSNGSNTPPYDTYAKAAHRIKDANALAVAHGDTVLVHAGEYSVDSSLFIQPRVDWIGISRDSVTVIWESTEYGSTFLARLIGQSEVAGMEFYYPFGTSNHEAYAIWSQSYADFDTVFVHDCRFRLFKLVLGGNTRGMIHDNEFFHDRDEGVLARSNFAKITNNLFSGLHNGGYGVRILDGGVVILEQNVFDNTLTSSGNILEQPDATLYVNGAAQVTLRNNLLRWSRRPFTWYYANGVIENNTFIDTGDPFAVSGIDDSHFFQRYDQTLVIRNNLFSESARLQFGLECGDCDSTGWITLSYNAYWPPVDSFYRTFEGDPPELIKVFDTANINAFPMLDSLLRLQEHSPLIDTGDITLLDVDGSRSDVGWTGGPGGLSATYEDLAPLPPDSLAAMEVSGAVHLSWARRFEADLHSYRMYRDVRSSALSTPSVLLKEVPESDSSYVDSSVDIGQTYFYTVTAVDGADNESEASIEVEHVYTTIDSERDGAVVPLTPHINRAYPNPFNASTVIELQLPAEASVVVDICNVLGQRVTQVFQGTLDAGVHTIGWEAIDQYGQPLPSGVYFAQLSRYGGNVLQTVQLVLIR